MHEAEFYFISKWKWTEDDDALQFQLECLESTSFTESGSSLVTLILHNSDTWHTMRHVIKVISIFELCHLLQSWEFWHKIFKVLFVSSHRLKYSCHFYSWKCHQIVFRTSVSKGNSEFMFNHMKYIRIINFGWRSINKQFLSSFSSVLQFLSAVMQKDYRKALKYCKLSKSSHFLCSKVIFPIFIVYSDIDFQYILSNQIFSTRFWTKQHNGQGVLSIDRRKNEM